MTLKRIFKFKKPFEMTTQTATSSSRITWTDENSLSIMNTAWAWHSCPTDNANTPWMAQMAPRQSNSPRTVQTTQPWHKQPKNDINHPAQGKQCKDKLQCEQPKKQPMHNLNNPSTMQTAQPQCKQPDHNTNGHIIPQMTWWYPGGPIEKVGTLSCSC